MIDISAHSGIGEKEDSIVIRLVGGSNEPLAVGDTFEVLNTASSARWGVLEVIEVEGDSCVGQVSDRIRVEFRVQLESRVRRDPSPPTGVTLKAHPRLGRMRNVSKRESRGDP